jgi:hypothetical protein
MDHALATVGGLFENRLAMSHRWTSWKHGMLTSLPSEIANWNKLAGSGNSVGNNHDPQPLAQKH